MTWVFALVPLGFLVLGAFLSTMATAMIEDDPRGAPIMAAWAADPWGCDLQPLLLEAGLTRAAKTLDAAGACSLAGAVLGVACCGLVFM